MYKHIGNYSMISYFSKCYSEGTYGNFNDIINNKRGPAIVDES